MELAQYSGVSGTRSRRRPNVGKSLLINGFISIKGTSRASWTPGRAQSLNFLSLGEELAIVDPPGYAQLPRRGRAGCEVA